MDKTRVKLLFVVNIPEFFLSHRLPIAEAARDAGYEVHIATGPGEASKRIVELGFNHHELPLSRSGRNPLEEIRFVWALRKLLRQIHPDIVHFVTIKPVLYGGIVSRLMRVPAVVAAISGLGTLYVSTSNGQALVRRGVTFLYRFALGHKNIKILCQNPDDLNMVMRVGSLRHEQTELIRGSGVELARYPVMPEPTGVPVVTFAARLLKDKGVMEFINAIRLLKLSNLEARFWLVGSPDPDNISSITQREVSVWQNEGLIESFGYREDIADIFAKSNIVVLPSYREGLPKVLIEAAACGRAIITTDVPGCRDAISPGESGLLVPLRDAPALANAIKSLIDDPIRRSNMGKAGRDLAEREFRIETVIGQHLTIYQQLSQPKSR